MSGPRKDELIPVVLDIRGENRKMVEDIADNVLRRVLQEDEVLEQNGVKSRTPNTTSDSPSSHSINQLLASSFSPNTTMAVPMPLNQFQLALCQSLASNNTISFPVFGGPLPILPLFVPPPHPSIESVELLRIFQNILAKQRK